MYLYYLDFGGIPTSQRDGSEYKFVLVLFSSKVGASRQLIIWGVFLGVSYFVRGVQMILGGSVLVYSCDVLRVYKFK